MRGGVFMPSRDGDARPSVCSQTLTHELSPVTFSSSSPQPAFHSPASAPSVSAPLSSPPCSPSLSFTFPAPHTSTHRLSFPSFLSKASLKELWLCGLEEIQMLSHFVGFSPEKTIKTTSTGLWTEKTCSTWMLRTGGLKTDTFLLALFLFISSIRTDCVVRVQSDYCRHLLLSMQTITNYKWYLFPLILAVESS